MNDVNENGQTQVANIAEGVFFLSLAHFNSIPNIGQQCTNTTPL
jgi:hypothetical protein